MQAFANSGVFWILLFLVLAVVYLLPTIVGLVRGVDRLALVFLVNLIGAPTGIGWFAAMLLAFGPRHLSTADRRECHVPGSQAAGVQARVCGPGCGRKAGPICRI